MIDEAWLKDFEAKYKKWLSSAKPYLEEANWKDGFKEYPFVKNDTSPFTPFKKELKDSRIALVSTAGFYVKNKQVPFDAANYTGDYSYREIPSSEPVSSLAISHDHYDKKYALADPNVVYPVERLKELEKEGLFKSLENTVFSFQGYIPQVHNFLRISVPEIVNKLKERDVDAVLLIPV